FFRSIFVPDSAATLSSSCSRSLAARANSPADIGLNTTAATPAVRSPSSTSSVTCAVARAKSRSFFARPAFGRLPNGFLNGNGLSQLAGDLGQTREPLLERRMVGEELERASAERNDEERLRARHAPQVGVRNPPRVAVELRQRAHQLLGCTRQVRG